MTKIPTDGGVTYNALLKTKDSKTAKKLAEDFEAFFVTTMLKEMDKTTQVTKKSFMKETYSAIMYEKLGEYVAKKGIGIKDMLMKYMERGGEAKVSNETGDNNGT